MCRLPLSVVRFVLCLWGGRVSAAGPVPAGKVRFEFELLRAPAQEVAEALLDLTGAARDEGALRRRLLAGGAKSIVRSMLMVPPGKEVKDDHLKTTREAPLFDYAQLWQEQLDAAKQGIEIPRIEPDQLTRTHVEGHSLTAAFTDEAEAGTMAEVRFVWAGQPIVRKVNSWPIKGRPARILQDRLWETEVQRRLAGGGFQLLAAAPEPPDAGGSSTGYVLLAFGKSTSSNDRAAAAKYRPRLLQCWTLEMPAAAGARWLAARSGFRSDESRFKELLRAGVRTGSASLISTLVLPGGDRKRSTIHSRLTWEEPVGFEPSDRRCAPFIPVPNDAFDREVGQRLITGDGEAGIRLSVDGVKWTRWYGSTRGVVDEPTGVESSATGATDCTFVTSREPGRIFLANGHICGPKMRLTFSRTFSPKNEYPPACEPTLQILETPLDPWLPALAGGADPSSFLPQLLAALSEGTASVIHAEVFTLNSRWQREDSWPWFAIGRDYLNPCIDDGRFLFNPRAVTGSSPACNIEAENAGAFDATVCGKPAASRFGLWLPGVAGHSAESSGISLTEWPHLRLHAAVSLPHGRDLVLHAIMGRSWIHPGQPALHWLLFRNNIIPGSGPAPPVAASDPEPGPPTYACFTITGKDGGILFHATLPAAHASAEDGRMVQSLEPRSIPIEQYFQEAVSKDARDGGKSLAHQPQIAQGLDGVKVSISEGRWTLESPLSPARNITETLTGNTEHYVHGDFKTEPVPVSCERLVMRRETLTGTLPAPGAEEKRGLDGARILTVRLR